MAENASRRSFIRKGAMAGAVSLIAGQGVEAEQKKPDRKLKVGVFGIDYTFWRNIWADLLSPKGKHAKTNLLNMEVSLVWDKDMKKAQEFANRWECKVVKKYDDMLGKVDGVVNGGFYNVPWQHKMLRPYIEAGVPTYLSRPWSSRLHDLDSMLELAAKHNTPLCATATYEHYNEADSYRKKLKDIGKVKAAFATCSTGEYPAHFHLPYMMMKILGYNVDQVSLITNDPQRTSYMQDTYVYGEAENQPPFVLSMHAVPSVYVFSFTIIGTEGTESSQMPGESSYLFRFMPQLIDIQKTLEGKTYQPFDIIRKKFEVFIAGYYSHVERGGAPVKVGSVPSDWQFPLWKPDWYDDSDFKD